METNRRRHAMSGQKRAVLFAALLVLTMAALIGVNSAPELSAAPTNSQASASALRASGFASGPDRDVTVSQVATKAGKAKGHVDLTANVQIKNKGTRAFNVAQGEFYLSALGDSLGHVVASSGALSGSSVAQGATVAGGLTFDIPADAEPYVVLVDRPATGAAPVSVPLGVKTPAGAVAGISYLSNTSSTSATSSNTIEDNFQRANQSGWGTSTNADGVSNVTWGMDGSGVSSVKIANNTGVYGYPGAINQVGIASAGSAAYNGGDVLARLSVSAVGQVIPYISLDDCADKSCYYGARIQTSDNHLEIARRANGSTGVMASVPFTASANTVYWLRLQVTPGAPTQIEAKVWADGTPEPNWMVSASDSAPLAANRVGAGGSWDATGTGESINYTCFAYASSGLASACGTTGGGGTPTPTPTPTNTPTNTPTPTPTNTPTNTPTPTPTNTPTNTPTPTPTQTTTPTPTPTGNGNTIEDNFQRANQSGWGTSTNTDGVSNVTWGMDGSGLSSVQIVNNTGVYGYPGAINQVGIASAGSAAYNGGDVLARLSVSAVGQVIPYISLDDCADKSCYYGARIQTSDNRLELARRANGNTGIMAYVPFTASANTVYWLRLQVTPGAPTQIEAKVWADGTPEPNWMVSASDSAPLAANRVGAGGSWDATGTGESINYTCFAYASSGLASACGTSGGGGTPTPTPTPTNTPTPTPTNTPTNTPTPTPTNTPTNTPTPSPTPAPTLKTLYLNNGGVGEPWGTAIDSAGNVWFAEPGCDFAPTCSSSTPPGQIGELPAGSSTAKFWTLPNITGNQPIFVALDGSGNVWFTTPDNSMIGEFSPSTQTFVGQWAVTANSGPWDLTFNNGKIWYTEHLVSAIGEFDPSTHTYKDFQTPSAGSNPYGIAGNDPANANLVWFAENADTVGKIGVMNTSTNTITEYSIQAQPQSGLTPHMITIDAHGNPWWTEGWVRSVGTINVSVANPSSCGVSSGDCNGVTEFPLGQPGTTCSGVHISGITIPAGGSTVWVTDALQSQVIALTPSTDATSVTQLSSCGAHPHDGLNHDPSSDIWWDEEFANALGEWIP